MSTTRSVTLVCRSDGAPVRRELGLEGTLDERYELMEMLGAGGTGTVYRARRRADGQVVAVKVLNEPADAEHCARFAQEGELMLALRHPRVVRVLDIGELGGHPYLVADYLDGGNLRERLGRGKPLPVEQATALVADLLEGLDACHARGIVHRDVKPENVFLDPAGRALLGDLGAARDTGRTGAALTRTGGVIGTPAYMSPEQARGEPAVAASDLYAAGLILYEALAGEAAFSGAHPLELLRMHRELEPAPLRMQRPDLPPALTDLVSRALSKNPVDRPLSATAFATALREFGATVPAALARAGSPDPRARAGSPALSALGIGAAAAILGALVLAIPRERTRPAPSRSSSAPAVTGIRALATPPATIAPAFAAAPVSSGASASAPASVEGFASVAAPASSVAPAVAASVAASRAPVARPRPRKLVFSRTFPARGEGALAPAKALWERDLDGGVELERVVHVQREGPFLVMLRDARGGVSLAALDAVRGNVLWTQATPVGASEGPAGALPCAVVFGNTGRVAVVVPGRDLTVLEASSGRVVKQVALAHRPVAPSVLDVESGSVHVGGAGGIVKLSGTGGWSWLTGGVQPQDPGLEAPSYEVAGGWRPVTAGRGFGVLQDADNAVRLVDLESGKTLWTRPLGLPIRCAKVAMGDAAKLVFLCGEHLYVCSHPGGLLRRTADLGGSIERISEEGGMLYLLHAPGYLSIVDYETLDPIFRFKDTSALKLVMQSDVTISPGGRVRVLAPRAGDVRAELALPAAGAPYRHLLIHEDRIITAVPLAGGRTRVSAFAMP